MMPEEFAITLPPQVRASEEFLARRTSAEFALFLNAIASPDARFSTPDVAEFDVTDVNDSPVSPNELPKFTAPVNGNDPPDLNRAPLVTAAAHELAALPQLLSPTDG
jgi:hypothetical protein